MYILHLTHTDVTTDNRILKQIIALLKIKNYKVSCFGIKLKEGSSKSSFKIKANIVNISLITKIKIIPKTLRHFLMFFELFIRFSLLSLKVKPNIIHCHDTLVLPIGVFLSKIFNSKLIYDAHELESNKNGQSKFLSKATLLIEKLSWSHINHLITVSDSIIDWYESNIGKKENTLILNSPLTRSNHNIKRENYFHKRYNISNDKLIFVYLGILGKGRGIDFIIDAFSKDSIKSHVVFVGYGDYYEKINKISKSVNNIHIHNAVPHDDVVSLVKNADIGLCLIENISLSDYYCLPNKLFEYTFAGLPILASRFPEIEKIILKYNLGYTCELNSGSINNAIIEIEKSPTKKIKSDLRKISWQNQEKKLTICYKNLEIINNN